MHSAVYDAVKKNGKLFTKKLLLKNTEHGEKIANANFKELGKTNPGLAEKRKFKGNFITYAKRASKKMSEEKILTQIKPHRKIMKKAMNIMTIITKKIPITPKILQKMKMSAKNVIGIMKFTAGEITPIIGNSKTIRAIPHFTTKSA